MTLTHARLLEVLDYDPLTGIFTRKVFKNQAAQTRDQHEKKRSRKLNSYQYITVDQIKYSGHRLAWFYIYGKWPRYNVDHIDQNRSNNAIVNLREAPGSINQINCKIHRHNTSGIKGVSWSKGNGKWTASIYQNNKRINLGYFETKEAAHKARLLAESIYY